MHFYIWLEKSFIGSISKITSITPLFRLFNVKRPFSFYWGEGWTRANYFTLGLSKIATNRKNVVILGNGRTMGETGKTNRRKRKNREAYMSDEDGGSLLMKSVVLSRISFFCCYLICSCISFWKRYSDFSRRGLQFLSDFYWYFRMSC